MEHADINKLYKRFKNTMMRALKRDSFYEEFSRVLSGGKHVYSQQHTELIKRVDKDWVHAFYGALAAIETITKNPRRVIKTESQVVPVELARKTTAESVKHLASHTHYINRIDERGVIPSKILNISNEESLDTYENRFVNTLINRMNMFLAKRLDVIGDSIGNEFVGLLSVDSDFTDNHEQVLYKLDMRISQDAMFFADGAESNNLLQMLRTIREYVNGFRHSDFMRALKNTVVVRSPVVRTNLLVKEPNYRKCYELWNFIDKYDKVGYTIKSSDTKPDFTPEFLTEINAALMMHYVMLKQQIESMRKLAEQQRSRVRTKKPRFLKRFEDVLADSRDLDDFYEWKHSRDGERSEKLDKLVLGAINRAVKLEEDRKAEQEREREQKIAQALRRAVDLEHRRREEEREREEAARHERRILGAINRALEIEQRRRRKREELRLRKERDITSAIERAIEIAEENLRIRRLVKQILRTEDELKAAQRVQSAIAHIRRTGSRPAFRRSSADGGDGDSGNDG